MGWALVVTACANKVNSVGPAHRALMGALRERLRLLQCRRSQIAC